MKIEVIKAIQAIGDKMTAEEIQMAFGIGIDEKEGVRLERLNIPSNAHLTDAETWKKYEENKLIELRDQGKTANEIADNLNRSASSVRSKTTQLIRNGRIEPKENMAKLKTEPKKYSESEIEEMKLALEVYGEPKEAMKDKDWVDYFCQRYNRTRGAVSTKFYHLHSLKNKNKQKSTH